MKLRELKTEEADDLTLPTFFGYEERRAEMAVLRRTSE